MLARDVPAYVLERPIAARADTGGRPLLHLRDDATSGPQRRLYIVTPRSDPPAVAALTLEPLTELLRLRLTGEGERVTVRAVEATRVVGERLLAHRVGEREEDAALAAFLDDERLSAF